MLSFLTPKLGILVIDQYFEEPVNLLLLADGDYICHLFAYLAVVVQLAMEFLFAAVTQSQFFVCAVTEIPLWRLATITTFRGSLLLVFGAWRFFPINMHM